MWMQQIGTQQQLLTMSTIITRFCFVNATIPGYTICLKSMCFQDLNELENEYCHYSVGKKFQILNLASARLDLQEPILFS